MQPRPGVVFFDGFVGEKQYGYYNLESTKNSKDLPL
jgi:hypothetical protein